MPKKKDMPKGETKYLTKRNGTYYFVKRVDGKPFRKSLDTGNVEKAREKRDKWLALLGIKDRASRLNAIRLEVDDAAQQAAVMERDLQDKRLRLPATWKAYLKHPERSRAGEGTLSNYAREWAVFVAWMTERGQGEACLQDVDRETALAYATYLDDYCRTPNTYNKYLGTAKRVVKVLADEMGDRPNPFDRIPLRPPDTKGHRPLTLPELEKLWAAAAGEWRTFVALGLYTALRLKDVCQLDWSEVDLAAGRIVRRAAKTSRRARKSVIVPLHPQLAAILQATPAADRRGPVMPRLDNLHRRQPSNVTRPFRALLESEAVGIDTREGREAGDMPVVSFHSLRHTFATLASQGGGSDAALQELLGHQSEAMKRVYIHTGADAVQAAVAALPHMDDQKTALTDAQKLAAIAKRVAPKQPAKGLAADIRRILKG